MKIAVAQIASLLVISTRTSPRLATFLRKLRRLAPSLSCFRRWWIPVIQAHATPWTSGAVPELRKIARDLSIAIISGVSERKGASIYNSQAAT